MIGLSFTGYLLRWDQDGFWASVVGMKIGSYSPFVGGYVIHFLLGGDAVGPATLSRFFAIHVWLLPAAIAPLIGAHLYLLRRHGVFGSRVRVHGQAREAARAPAPRRVRPLRDDRGRGRALCGPSRPRRQGKGQRVTAFTENKCVPLVRLVHES